MNITGQLKLEIFGMLANEKRCILKNKSFVMLGYAVELHGDVFNGTNSHEVKVNLCRALVLSQSVVSR